MRTPVNGAVAGTAILAVLAILAAAIALSRLRSSREAEASRLPDRIEEVRATLFDALRPVALANCDLERFGEPHDGGYLMCANLLDPVEAAYSYGIGSFDGWGCQISERLGVPVHRYDCFDTRDPPCPGGNAIFHAECIAASAAIEDGRLFDTLERQIALNGDAGKRLVLKIDVEGAEWDAFLAAPDEVLDRIDQLVVEFHGVNEARFLLAVRKLKRLFHVGHLHFNNAACAGDAAPFPSTVYEALLVNKRIAREDPARPAPRGHPAAARNLPELPDCQELPGS